MTLIEFSRVQLDAQLIKLCIYSVYIQHWICHFSYSLSVQLASNFQLSSDWIDGERAALVTIHNGVPHVIVRRPIRILSDHLWINQTVKTIINERSLKVFRLCFCLCSSLVQNEEWLEENVISFQCTKQSQFCNAQISNWGGKLTRLTRVKLA